jgi:type I restriction enzyme M protein
MAIKKSELYSSLWASCDTLRGGMEPNEYKNYILTMLFFKYVSDKAKNDPFTLIKVPDEASFGYIQQYKGNKEISEKLDTALSEIAKKNELVGVVDVVSFQDTEKLGKGKEMVDKLTELISIFENPALNFSNNRADNDDILGDAYEYLMRNFASASGKSKGEFYTPSEVSKLIAQIIGIQKNPSEIQTIYDPTCGSGSLLLKVAEEADNKVTIYGQEKTTITAGLALMNMIIHAQPTAEIAKGQSTLAEPLHYERNTGELKKFDFVVANPPFSLKNWSDGFDPQNDLHQRFTAGMIPPQKNGDYAFLLHIIKSLKTTGKGACILPHGVLFRGNVEAEIRKDLVKKGYIKGIIGLPPNLFYGTGIPACIIIIDLDNAQIQRNLSDEQKGIFMIDASKGFIKDGNKNRLREQDIHKIMEVFTQQITRPKFSRFVSYTEISDPKNDFNLNIPRYIDSQEQEDIHDIQAHLQGGIPQKDIDDLQNYWDVYPDLKNYLFSPLREGYLKLNVKIANLKNEIFAHPQFTDFNQKMNLVFEDWKNETALYFDALDKGIRPKNIIKYIAQTLLNAYSDKKLIDKYDIYQYLFDYWNQTIQDDCYIIAGDGWIAEPTRIIEKNKATKKDTDKGWDCELLPKSLVIKHFFSQDKQKIDLLSSQVELYTAQLAEIEEEHTQEDGLFADFEKINKAIIEKELKNINSLLDKKNKNQPNNEAENKTKKQVFEQYIALSEKIKTTTKQLKDDTLALDNKVFVFYKTLNIQQIKDIVIQDKWLNELQKRINGEMQRISQRLTQRIKQLAERYHNPLPQITQQTQDAEDKVLKHLQKMGFSS